MQCLEKKTILHHLNQLTNYNKFKVKLNNIENKFPHSTISKNRMLEHFIFQCNVFIGKNTILHYFNQLTNYNKFKVKLNTIENKFPHSTISEK